MKRINRASFFIVLALVMAISYLAIFGLGKLPGANKLRFGIDIKGGVEAVYMAKDLDRKPTSAELDATRAVLETRLDAKNILDREVIVDKENGTVLIRFPWKSDEKDFNPQKAISELGETAQLTFKDPSGKVLIEGKNVKTSTSAYDPNTGQNVVKLEFDSTGAKLFADATERLVGKQISIYMDDTLISDPVVNEKIPNGEAVISGKGTTLEEAKLLSDKINSGALPFSLISKNQSTISPILGTEALIVMEMAGIVALIAIFIFMISYYRVPGLVACIGIILQISFQLLMLSIPQITLTLPGIAGVILSIGMGVDTNIVIAERIKEEINTGKTIGASITSGYHRAFSAILDGNITTMIVAVILIVLGSGAMLSFGYTLLTGIIMNFVSGVLLSKIMLTSLSCYSSKKNHFIRC